MIFILKLFLKFKSLISFFWFNCISIKIKFQLIWKIFLFKLKLFSFTEIMRHSLRMNLITVVNIRQVLLCRSLRQNKAWRGFCVLRRVSFLRLILREHSRAPLFRAFNHELHVLAYHIKGDPTRAVRRTSRTINRHTIFKGKKAHTAEHSSIVEYIVRDGVGARRRSRTRRKG